MRDHYLTFKDVKEIIYDLSFKNYVKGPETDYGEYEGTIWVFKYDLDGIIIYIKFRYNDPEVVCISFHEDESDCWG